MAPAAGNRFGSLTTRRPFNEPSAVGWDGEGEHRPKPTPRQSQDDEQEHKGDQQCQLQGPGFLPEEGLVVPVIGEARNREFGVANRDRPHAPG